MSKNRVGKKRNRIRNELQSLGIDIENLQYTCDPNKIPTAREGYAMLRHYAKKKKYKSNWAMAQHRNIYGDWPSRTWNSDPLMVPNPALLEYVYAAASAWRQERDKAAAEHDEILLAQKARERQ